MGPRAAGVGNANRILVYHSGRSQCRLRQRSHSDLAGHREYLGRRLSPLRGYAIRPFFELAGYSKNRSSHSPDPGAPRRVFSMRRSRLERILNESPYGEQVVLAAWGGRVRRTSPPVLFSVAAVLTAFFSILWDASRSS